MPHTHNSTPNNPLSGAPNHPTHNDRPRRRRPNPSAPPLHPSLPRPRPRPRPQRRDARLPFPNAPLHQHRIHATDHPASRRKRLRAPRHHAPKPSARGVAASHAHRSLVPAAPRVEIAHRGLPGCGDGHDGGGEGEGTAFPHDGEGG